MAVGMPRTSLAKDAMRGDPWGPAQLKEISPPSSAAPQAPSSWAWAGVRGSCEEKARRGGSLDLPCPPAQLALLGRCSSCQRLGEGQDLQMTPSPTQTLPVAPAAASLLPLPPHSPSDGQNLYFYQGFPKKEGKNFFIRTNQSLVLLRNKKAERHGGSIQEEP